MKKLLFVLILIGLSFYIIRCGHVPAIYYYRIDYELPKPDSLNSVIPITLGIKEFETDVIYKGDKIVYRNSPYEVQYYHYRRWVAPPRKLVKEKILEQLKASGDFDNVVSMSNSYKVDYILSGKIKAFEEWDQADSWYGIVTIAFELYRIDTEEVVWEDVFSESTKALKREPIEVIKAISTSLQKVVEMARIEIKQKLRSHK